MVNVGMLDETGLYKCNEVHASEELEAQGRASLSIGYWFDDFEIGVCGIWVGMRDHKDIHVDMGGRMGT